MVNSVYEGTKTIWKNGSWVKQVRKKAALMNPTID
jgi:hypothetical protein